MNAYMDLLPLVTSGLIGALVLGGYMAITGFASERERGRELRTKISRFARTARAHGENDRRVSPVTLSLSLLAGIGRLLRKDASSTSESRTRLLQAGIRSRHAPLALLGAKVLLAIIVAGVIVGSTLAFPGALPKRFALLAGPLLIIIGFILPDVWVRSRLNRRKETLFRELPEALDLMVVCVEAGMGLDQALQRVSSELVISAPNVSDEFSLYNLEVLAGKKRQEALRSLAQRMGLEEMDNLVTVLTQADNYGTSVAQALRVYSDTLRSTRYQLAQEKAGKVPVKLLFPLIFFILPSLMVVILGPAVIRIIDMFSRIN